MEAILHKGLQNKYFSICNLRLIHETHISGFFLKFDFKFVKPKFEKDQLK